jgi:hypothetical protein
MAVYWGREDDAIQVTTTLRHYVHKVASANEDTLKFVGGNPDEESLQFASGAGFLPTGIAKTRAIRSGFSVPAVPASAFLLCEEMID